MSKSKARFLSELLGSTGLVKKSKSALAGADEVLDLDTIPTIPNSKLQNSSISIAGHSTALGDSVSLNTGNISEHTNYKYFTEARARGAVSASGDLSYNSSTGVISFTERTNAEVRGLVSAGGNLSYNSSTGVFSYTTPTTIASLSNHDTADLAEGTNLYFTNARARSAISGTGSLSYNSSTGVMSFTMPAQNTSNITEGTNLYYTNARADARIAAATTDDLSEGSSNLYYTDARADARIALIVDSAPGTLNTLNELAAALGDDANFSTTVTNSIATKLPLAGGALTGAVTTNSTFDGRNVSVDGAKLDGIETGATADQTAAEILTAIKTVDGSGSGLDADLLDGIDSGSFLRSDANDVYNGTLTINGMDFKVSNAVRNLKIQASTGGSDVGISGFRADGAHGFQVYGDGTNYGFLDGNWANWDLKKAKNGQLQVDEGSGLVKVWTAGNDGSGSGLDADLLDGIDSGSFLRSDTPDTFGSQLSSANNVPIRFVAANAIDSNDGKIGAGVFSTGLNIVGAQTAAGTGRQVRIWGDVITDGGLKYWNANNDGSGSGLDADTVDGYQAANLRIINSEYNGSVGTAGWYTIAEYGNGRAQAEFHVYDQDSSRHNYVKLHVVWSFGNGGITCVSNGRHGTVTITHARLLYNTTDQTYGGCKLQIYCANPTWTLRVRQVGSQFSGWGAFTQTTISQADSVTNFAEYSRASNLHLNGGLSTSGSTWYAANNLVWTAGNDGSGSGLDADLLDGQHASAFLTAETDTLATVTGRGSTTSNNVDFGKVLVGGSYSNNSYSTVSSTRLLFGGGNDQDNYFIGTNLENYGGNYTKLDLRWHTGIRMGAQPGYGGIRFFNNEDLGSVLFSIGKGDTNMRVEGGNMLFTGDRLAIFGPNTGYSRELAIGGNANNSTSTRASIGVTNGNLHIDSASGNATYLNFYDGTSGVAFGNGAVATVAWMGPDGDLWKGSLDNTGSKYWHAGNDGSGSGLDADNLDGRTWSESVVANTIVSRQANGYIYANHINFSTSETENPTINSFFVSNGDGWSRKASKAHVISQLGVFTTSNDGSGSGLDADTVDGIQGASFLRSDATDTATGSVSLRAGGNHLGNHEFAASSTSTSYSVAAIELRESNYTSSSAATPPHLGFHWGNVVASSISMDSGGAIIIRNNPGTAYENFRANNIYANGTNLVWHVGNDGSGSGLDADLLDGQQGSYYYAASNPSGYITSSGTASQSNMVTGSSFATTGSPGSVLEYQQASSITDTKLAPSGDWYNSIRMGHGNPYSYYSNTMAVKMTGSNVGQLYIQTISNNNAQGWRQVWDSSSDGSGSGLDADTLDGVQGASYVRSDAADTISGDIAFTGGHGAINITSSSIVSNASSTWTGDPGAQGKIQYHSNRWYIVADSSSNRIVQFRRNGTDVSYIDNSGKFIGDVDTVDGVHATSLLRSDTADTIENNVVIAQRGSFTTGTSGQNNSGIGGSYHYGYQTTGAWTHPYPDLVMGYHTGMRFGGYTAYGGCRFYDDHPNRTSTILFSVGNGDSHVRVTNNIYATQFLYNSDRAYKENIYPLENSLQKVLKLEGVNYTLKSNGTELIGFIAQDVEKIEPKVVDGKEGEKAVNYGQMVALLTEAMKEQQNMIVALQEEVKELKNATK